MADEKPMTKIKDLTPEHKQVNVLVKVVNVGESKEIPSRFGKARKVAEATVGDETGTIVLSLWQDQIGTIQNGDVINIDNGFISLVRGHMRLNVGKYGKLEKRETPMDTVDSANDMSAKEYPYEERSFQRRESSFGGDRRRSGGGGGDRDRRRIGGF